MEQTKFLKYSAGLEPLTIGTVRNHSSHMTTTTIKFMTRIPIFMEIFP
jgi:hypothetical protein